MGCPIRISTDQSLLAAPRGFSQRATSFIASWCQGIHRMPFSRSNPGHMPKHAAQAYHAQKPSADPHARERQKEQTTSCTAQHTRPVLNGVITRHTDRSYAPVNTIRPVATSRLPCGNQPRSVRHCDQTGKGYEPSPAGQRAHRRTRTRFTPSTNTHQSPHRPRHTRRAHPGCPHNRNSHDAHTDRFASNRDVMTPAPHHPLDAQRAEQAVVETIGVEPMTPCLQSRCSTS